jgi:hypothetical protein
MVYLWIKVGELTGVTAAQRQENLANVDTGDSAVGLTPGTTHTGLQSIGTSARQHLVDTDDVVRVGTDSQVEGILATTSLDHVLVGANTGGFESLGTQLLVLVGDEVNAEGELIDTSALATEIEDSDLRAAMRSVTIVVNVEITLTYSGTPLLKRDLG